MIGTEDGLLTYLGDLVEEVERLGVTVLPPNDSDDIVLGREPDGSLVIDLECRPPLAPRARRVHIDLFERWRPFGRDRYERTEYAFEIRHEGLQYRRAFHRHHAEAFLRAFDVACHEHCEATMGAATCGHYFGEPVADARTGFLRLYALWLSDERPDCATLTCLE